MAVVNSVSNSTQLYTLYSANPTKPSKTYAEVSSQIKQEIPTQTEPTIHSGSHMLSMLLAGWFQKRLEAEKINLQEAQGEISLEQKEGMKQNLSDTHSLQKSTTSEDVKVVDLKTYMENIESFSDNGSTDKGVDIDA